MALSIQFLDELRARTTLSALVGRSVKLKKAGREHKGCCPFHQEKTASFTVSDEKGFYHCFGCGAHGDAIRWLTDAKGMDFIDAVKDLAAAAGMEVPAPSPEVAARAEKAGRLSDVLETAAAWYGRQLAAEPKMLAMLADRGIGADAIARFGLGYSPPKSSVASCGIAPERLEEAALLVRDEGSGLWRDRFRQRLMIPVRDHRGRIVAFAARATREGQEPKYVNSPETAGFAKGDTLFNLDRAAPVARPSRRLVMVEGQFDAIALDLAGIVETVAPMGTALTERQLERAWRVADRPTLLFDGDAAGRKAALRAAERALPHIGPERSLSVALLPQGEDPDSLVRQQGRDAIEVRIAGADALDGFVWAALLAEAGVATPEGRSGLWKRLAALAGTIRDAETKAQYLAGWRARFDEAFPPAPPGLTDEDIVPDGGVGAILSGMGKGERANLVSVAVDWLARELVRIALRVAAMRKDDAAALAGRSAWEMGRRAGADLVSAEAGTEAVEALASTRGDLPVEALRKAFWFGCRRSASLLVTMRRDRRCALHHRTDVGNSLRWIERFGQDYLYTTAKGWLGWDGRRYRVLNQEKDTTPAEVLASVVAMVEGIAREARFVEATGWPEEEFIKPDLLAELEVDPRREGGLDRLVAAGKKPERLSAKLAAWSLASEAAGRINCIAGLVKRAVTVDLAEFDTDPMLLNCRNGTLRFVRGDDDGPARVELRPHDRADRLTRLTACDYDPNAPAALFVALTRWAQPDKVRRRYLRQWLGYNLTGDMGEQIFHVWYGPLAANGKSTVGNACREAIGDYGDAGKSETFLDVGINKRGDAATPDIVRLPGIRMVTAGEPKPGLAIDEPLINGITGGDPMLARDNFRSFFQFNPVFKFTLWCNALPPITRGTAGIWRRVKVIPWEQHLEDDQRDRDLPRKLQAEHAGILAWMVKGAIDWMSNGFVEPESVQLASADYKQDSDPLSVFLRTCTEVDPQGRVQSSLLYETFCAWTKAAGETEWKQKGFSQALKGKGIASKHSNGTHWLGINLTKAPTDFIDVETGKVRKLIAEDEWPPGHVPAPAAAAQAGGVGSPDDPDPWFDDTT